MLPPALTESNSNAQVNAPRALKWRWRIAGLAIIFVLWLLSLPTQDSQWLQGDERIFIANNYDVTGEPGEVSPWPRWLGILGHVHEDLYQPLPILSYALEWYLWGDQRVFFIRQTDVLLHGLNALLLWAVARRLLKRLGGWGESAARWGGFAAAVLWAFHPVLVSAYAADMGRTHLLAATFVLISTLLHIRALAVLDEPDRLAALQNELHSQPERPGAERASLRGAAKQSAGWFAGAWLMLLAAMMSKPLVGWIAVTIGLEAAWLGWKAMLRSPRIYLVAVLCGLFAYLTFVTTKAAGILDDSQLALFGDPLSRSCVAAGIYIHDIFWPVGLATWYPPDIHTAWTYPPAWLGVAVLLLSFIAIVAGARGNARVAAVGLTWYWAVLGPVLGVVGARAAAAQDRYLYLPLMGLLLALICWVGRWAAKPALGRLALVVAALAVAGQLSLVRGLIADDRWMIARANAALARDPGDPRLIEFSAMAAAHVRSYGDRHGKMDTAHEFEQRWQQRLADAAGLADQSPAYFHDAGDQAAFRRRISWQLILAGLYPEALREAEKARQLQPDAAFTWTSLGKAYRANQRWTEARAAYEKLLALPSTTPAFRAQRLTEYGDLLLYRFEDVEGARAQFRASLDTGFHIPEAGVGLARCEVLIGNGATGFEIARQVLEAQPDNLGAALVVGLYHMRSHHFPEAQQMYRRILRLQPDQYEALRGFHEVCLQLDQPRDAALAWQDAVRVAPNRPEFRGFFVWAAACADEDVAEVTARKILEQEPGNRFACLALMLRAMKAGKIAEAVDWVERATGPSLPEAKEFERAEATLRILRARQQLPAGGSLASAALRLGLGQVSDARAALEEEPGVRDDPALRVVYEGLLARAAKKSDSKRQF